MAWLKKLAAAVPSLGKPAVAGDWADMLELRAESAGGS